MLETDIFNTGIATCALSWSRNHCLVLNLVPLFFPNCIPQSSP